MRKPIVIVSAVAGLVVVGAVGAIAFALGQQAPVNESAQSIRLFYQGEYRNSDYLFDWTSNAIGANSNTDINAMFNCPTVSTEVFTFLSLRGQERNIQNGWQAFTQTSFFGDTKSVLTPNLKPSGFVSGTPGARYSRDHGGDFSLGLACTHGRGQIVDTVSYRSISVTAHSGQWRALPEPTIKTGK